MQDFRTKTFLDVCETLSYTRSAQRLNITQPAVSQHISYFENAYGAKLFSYHNRQLKLTKAGKLLRDALAVMVHDEQMIQEHIASLSGAHRLLSFGVTMTAGEYVLAKPLAHFLKQKPHLQTKIVASSTDALLNMLQEGNLDCAFVEGFFDKSEYESEVFCAEQLVALCSPEHQWTNQPKHLEDLLGEHLIIREKASGTRAVLEHALSNRNLTIEGFAQTTEVTSIGIIKTLVEQDYGITFLYEPAIRAECERGTLKKVALLDNPITHDFTFIWLKGSVFSDEFRSLARELATTPVI